MNHVTNPTKPDIMARMESESRADTTCAGNNMKLFSYTGYKCNVNGLHSELKSMEKITVAMAVTAYDDPLLVTTVMLVFDKVLWFGSSMGQTLISTTQVLSHGTQISYDPYDQNRPLGISIHNSDWYIYFNVQQYFSVVETRAPTIDDKMISLPSYI